MDTGHHALVRGLFLSAIIALGQGMAADNQTLLVSGEVRTFEGTLAIGLGGTNNWLVVTNAGSVTSVGGILGQEPEGYGNLVTISGTDSVWQVDGGLAIGKKGSSANKLLVTQGGGLLSTFAGIGDSSFSNIVMIADPGSSWSNLFYLTISGSSNQVVVTNSGRIECDLGRIGSADNSVDNEVLVTGDGSFFGAARLWLGEYGQSNRLFILDGGKVRCRSAGINVLTSGRDNSALVSDLGSAWEIAGSLRISGSGGLLVVTNGGRISCGSSEVVGIRHSATITGADSIWQVNTNLTISASSEATNHIWVQADGTLAVTNAAGNALLQLRNGGRLQIDGGNVVVDDLRLTNTWDFRNPGEVQIASGSLSVRNASMETAPRLALGIGTNPAHFVLRGGMFRFGSSLLLNPGIVLAGNGLLTGSPSYYVPDTIVTNRGIIAPGDPLGRLAIQSTLRTEGEVQVEIGGLEPGMGYDQLAVQDRVWLGGRLSVRVAEGFRPAWTNTFTVVTWDRRVGEFLNALDESRIAASGGGSFRVWYRAGGLDLGDYQRDEDNDGIDDLWAQTYFGHTPLSRAEKEGDPDGDGASNQNEAVAGTDPNQAGSLFRVTSAKSQSGKVSLQFSCVAGKRYQVWYSADLAAWTKIDNPELSFPEPGKAEWLDDGSQTSGPPATSSRRYYRIAVE